MKKIFLSTVFVVLVTSLFAQRTDEKDLKTLMKELGYSCSETKTTKLVEGASNYFWRTFYPGNEYAILSFSEDGDVYDLDLYLYNEKGLLLDKGNSREGFEIVEFTINEISDRKIVIKNYDCTAPLINYKCKFMIFYK